MAKTPKLREIPVFDPAETGIGYRFAAYFSYSLFGLIVMWPLFHKKNKFIRMHCKHAFPLVLQRAIAIVVLDVLSGIMNGVFLATVGTLTQEQAQTVSVIYSAVSGLLLAAFSIYMTVLTVFTLINIIYGFMGKLCSEKTLKKIVREQLSINNPEAIELINTDPRFADILAEYEAAKASRNV